MELFHLEGQSFVKERHREIVSFMHAYSARLKMHICGDITHLLSSMADLGIDILDIDWQINVLILFYDREREDSKDF